MPERFGNHGITACPYLPFTVRETISSSDRLESDLFLVQNVSKLYRLYRQPSDRLRELLPGATWTAAGIGRHQLEVNHWALQMGGHCRTGLEDNLKIDATRLAASNAELVKKVADNCERYGRRPATPAEAREILGLRAAA